MLHSINRLTRFFNYCILQNETVIWSQTISWCGCALFRESSMQTNIPNTFVTKLQKWKAKAGMLSRDSHITKSCRIKTKYKSRDMQFPRSKQKH